jgi:hypothetical protein
MPSFVIDGIFHKKTIQLSHEKKISVSYINGPFLKYTAYIPTN